MEKWSAVQTPGKKGGGRAGKWTQTCRHRTARSSCLHTELNCLSGIKRYLRQPDKVKAQLVCEMKACRLTFCAAVSECLAFGILPSSANTSELLFKKNKTGAFLETNGLLGKHQKQTLLGHAWQQAPALSSHKHFKISQHDMEKLMRRLM